MSKSERLRLRDLRDIYRLIGQCRDLGHDAQGWRSHLLVELSRLVGGSVAMGGEFRGSSLESMRLFDALDFGWAGTKEREIWLAHMTEEGSGQDCAFQSFYRLLQSRRGAVTRLRRQLLDDREWFHSPHFNERRKPSRVDDCIYSGYPIAVAGQDVFDAMSFHRAPGEPCFGERERRLVYCFHRELGPLIGRQLASPSEPSFSTLSPRLRQTLERLLAGDSEKQIAHRLGLSRPTVHEYVTALYRRFGVHSRGELLALWNRFDRGMQTAAPQVV